MVCQAEYWDDISSHPLWLLGRAPRFVQHLSAADTSPPLSPRVAVPVIRPTVAVPQSVYSSHPYFTNSSKA